MCTYPKHVNTRANNFRAAVHADKCDAVINLWPKLPAKPTGHFVDVGANIGMCSLLFAAMGVNVITFEPHAEHVFFLETTLASTPRLSSFIKLYPIGVGSSATTTVAFTRTVDHFSALASSSVDQPQGQEQGQPYEVPVATLDAVLDCDISIELLRVNVEERALDVLQGASGLLVRKQIRNIHAVVLSVTGPDSPLCRLVAHLASFDYTVHTNGKLNRLDATTCVTVPYPPGSQPDEEEGGGGTAGGEAVARAAIFQITATLS